MKLERARLVLLLVMLSVSITRAQNVKVGYDKSTEFAQFKTYAWIPRTTQSSMPLVGTKIQLDVDYELGQKGLRKVASDPDLLVTYQSGIEGQSAAGAHDPGFTGTGGYPLPNDTMWGGSLPAGSVQHVVKGTLAVSLINARQKQTVWSGIAKANLDYEHQEKLYDQVGKAITKMFKKYPPSKEKSDDGER
jgi:hypothetical protein